MTVVSSKSQFLKCIFECEIHVNRLIKDNKKSDIFVAGIKAIKQVLESMPDELPFGKSESLEFEGDFSDFVCDSNDDELKFRLESIVRELSELRGIYQRFIPLLKQEVVYCAHEKGRLPKRCIKKSALIRFIQKHKLADIEQKFKSILEMLREAAVYSQNGAVPTAVEQKNMRLRLKERMGAIVLRLPEGNSMLCDCLNSANRELQNMIFPKNDKSVLQCYLLLMEALDDIDTTDEAVTVKRITSLMNQWKTMSR